MIEQRTSLSHATFDNVNYIRANFWSTEGKHSSKVCLSMGEAQSYLLFMKSRDGKFWEPKK